MFCFECNSVDFSYKMDDIINKCLLAGDIVLTYSAFGPFTKSKQKIQKFEETGGSRYIYRNELDKGCFQHDMAYGDFKNLARRTAPDKVLKDKAFNVTKDPKYDGYQNGLASMVYKFFDKKTADSGIKSMPQNEQLAEERHKPIIRKFIKRKVYSAFKDNIWGADLVDMQLVSTLIKDLYFYCVLLIFLANMPGLFL